MIILSNVGSSSTALFLSASRRQLADIERELIQTSAREIRRRIMDLEILDECGASQLYFRNRHLVEPRKISLRVGGS
jgi:hypothetical protein